MEKRFNRTKIHTLFFLFSSLLFQNSGKAKFGGDPDKSGGRKVKAEGKGEGGFCNLVQKINGKFEDIF